MKLYLFCVLIFVLPIFAKEDLSKYLSNKQCSDNWQETLKKFRYLQNLRTCQTSSSQEICNAISGNGEFAYAAQLGGNLGAGLAGSAVFRTARGSTKYELQGKIRDIKRQASRQN